MVRRVFLILKIALAAGFPVQPAKTVLAARVLGLLKENSSILEAGKYPDPILLYSDLKRGFLA